ncbi:heme-binding protein [Curvibacter sp. PAE-UM]|uniref:GlcG/HbpS family heme-binding protein n=1 Tax=Curvibacter sp. PAE-UM TaxID=1714344 RepID=UPI00070FC06F|nr:heme-binding protein [Curvibacter sp. PAE-UM]KRH98704.1 hypothetical protein AO057_04225 [Curvibacter sp. PAE-UM]
MIKTRKLLVVATLLLAGTAFAQTPNPLDVVAEKQPNDFPYGSPISLERADAVLAAAVAEARRRNWTLACAVVDSGTNLVSFKRVDGTQIGSIDVAIHKARASAKYKRPTKAFEAGIQGGNNYLLTLDDVIASRGGIPLMEGGKIIGAIGCSGASGAQDEVVANAGIAALK